MKLSQYKMSSDKPKRKSDLASLVNKYSEEISHYENSVVDPDASKMEVFWKKLAELYNERGLTKYLQVEFSGAVDDFTYAIKYQPELAVAYYNRGLVHYRLGRFDKAIDDMQHTLHLDQAFESAQQCLEQAILDKNKLRIDND